MKYCGASGAAYNPIVGAGVNSTVLHYNANDQPIADGDLVCIDAGAEFGRYAAKDRGDRGDGKPETFDFLGFTHICAKSRNGRFQLRRKTRRKAVVAEEPLYDPMNQRLRA